MLKAQLFCTQLFLFVMICQIQAMEETKSIKKFEVYIDQDARIYYLKPDKIKRHWNAFDLEEQYNALAMSCPFVQVKEINNTDHYIKKRNPFNVDSDMFNIIREGLPLCVLLGKKHKDEVLFKHRLTGLLEIFTLYDDPDTKKTIAQSLQEKLEAFKADPFHGEYINEDYYKKTYCNPLLERGIIVKNEDTNPSVLYKHGPNGYFTK